MNYDLTDIRDVCISASKFSQTVSKLILPSSLTKVMMKLIIQLIS